MDLATIIGMVAAIGMAFWSIWVGTDGKPDIYWDTGSVVLVIGGSIFVVLMTQSLDRYLGMFRIIQRGFFTKKMTIPQVIEQIIKLGEMARREGVLSLENALGDIEDDFLKNGIRLVIDGTAANEIEQILTSELEAMDQRHSQGKTIIDLFGKYAPAFGMIGTLIGLVAMLNNMDDPTAIGPGMAVAILTTFYGACIANIVCLPLSDKLGYRHDEEMLLRTVMLKGILSLQAGDNPRVTQAKLAVFLPINKRDAIEGPASRGKDDDGKK